MREPGTILLVSCYELGHQPLAVASPLAFLERAALKPKRSTSPSSSSTRARRQAPAGRDLRPHAHRPPAGSARGRGDPPGQPGLPHLLLRALRVAERRVPARALRRLGDRRRVRVGAGRRSPRRSRPGPASPTGGETAARHPARPVLERLPFPVPSRGELPSLKKYAHLEQGRPARAGRLRGGEPRLPAPVPALPDPARLRRALLRRAGGRSSSPTSASRCAPGRPTSRSATRTS